MITKVFLVVIIAAIVVIIIALCVAGIAGIYALNSQLADDVEKKAIITAIVATGIMVLFLLLIFVTSALGGGV